MRCVIVGCDVAASMSHGTPIDFFPPLKFVQTKNLCLRVSRLESKLLLQLLDK